MITHDLGVVANIADHIVVMYSGKVVEMGTSDEIFLSIQNIRIHGRLLKCGTESGTGA